MKSLLLGFVSAAALIAGGVSLAPAAVAAESPTCTANATVNLTGNSQSFTPGGSCTLVAWRLSTGILSPGDITVSINGTPLNISTDGAVSTGNTVTATYSGSAVGTYAVEFFNTGKTVTVRYEIAVTQGGGGSSDPSSTSGSGPAPLIQQFGMPATGTCDEAQPEGLNWSGVPSGGWGVSWAQWVNSGNGGAVCTRTLVYSTAQSKWVVD